MLMGWPGPQPSPVYDMVTYATAIAAFALRQKHCGCRRTRPVPTRGGSEVGSRPNFYRNERSCHACNIIAERNDGCARVCVCICSHPRLSSFCVLQQCHTTAYLHSSIEGWADRCDTHAGRGEGQRVKWSSQSTVGGGERHKGITDLRGDFRRRAFHDAAECMQWRTISCVQARSKRTCGVVNMQRRHCCVS